MDIDKIQSAFFPSREITDPEFFVGRKEEIKNSMFALSDSGSFLAIHGLRGVGKSSVAKQVQLIAEGNKVLPKTLKIDRFFVIAFLLCEQVSHRLAYSRKVPE